MCVTHTSFAFDVPLQLDSPNWQSLTYKNIKSNTVTQLDDGFKIEVDASASPLIYVFDEALTIQNITVSGQMAGLPTIPADAQQGDKNADDFPFRLGLVIEGDKTLNFAEKLIAPSWVKTLYELAPDGAGVDHIHFLNLANADKSSSWQQRNHPRSKGLFKETIVQQVTADEQFEMQYALPQATKVLALWISSDGDDTGSRYALTLKSISLK